MKNLNSLTIKEAKTGLMQKKFSSKELLSACLKQIEKHQNINSFVKVSDKKKLLKKAEKTDLSKPLGGIRMGKILSLLIGGITLILGLILLVAWWYELMFVLRGVIPVFLMVGGGVALMAGLGEYKDILKKKV